MSEKKKSGGALLGAAFLMATSAIGPGFLTQTATFTASNFFWLFFIIRLLPENELRKLPLLPLLSFPVLPAY